MRKSFDYNDIRRQVLEFLSKLDILPYDENDIVMDGELHRFRTRNDKPYEKSGAVIVHTDSWPAGYIQDWYKGINEYWKYDISALDEEQQKYFNSEEYRKICEEQERKAREERKARQLQASADARSLWDRLIPASAIHPYLIRKDIMSISWADDSTLRYNPNTKSLAVPLRNISGQLMSIQWIPEEGYKMFYEGASLDGAFWSIQLQGLSKDYKGVILLGEGFATMSKIFDLTDKPCAAAMTCYKLDETAKILRSQFPEAKIILTADNDHETERKHDRNPGLLYAQAVMKSKIFGKPLIDGVVFPKFKPEENGSDWDDFAILHGNEFTSAKLKKEIADSLIPENIKDMMRRQRLQLINAQALRSKVFQPVKWAVPGMIPSGLSILGGGPKIGKSMMALQLGIGISIGGYVFGKIQVQQGDVLYLALEDNERRLQERIENSNAINENDNISRLTLAYTVPRQHEGGLEFIDWWLGDHPDARLVIIDTLQKFRKQLSNKANVYAEDYDVLSEIKHIADKYDVAILILHHLKKVRPKDELAMDWIDFFSGSAGISGSADALFVLKRARQSAYGKLYRTGRDVEEAEFSLKLDGFGWCLDAEAETFVLPTWQKQILDFLKSSPTIAPLQLSQAHSLSINTAQKNLARLAKEGLIVKTGYGQYSLPAQHDPQEKTKD